MSMGYETRISETVSRMERSRQEAVVALKTKLSKYGT
jgi:hypothetical protein